MKSLEQFITDSGVQSMAIRLDESPPDHLGADCSVWEVELFRPGHDAKATTKFYMGTAYEGPPALEMVLEALQMDMWAVEDGSWESFEAFCGQYGFDQDSLKTYRMWESSSTEVFRQSEELQNLFGDDMYEEFLHEMEVSA